MTLFRMAVLTLTLVYAANAAEMRTWTGTNGTILDAEFVRELGGEVVLRTAQGRVITTRRTSLSQADCSYLDAIRPQKPSPQIAAAAPLPKPKGPPKDNSLIPMRTDHFGVRLGESTETFEWNCSQGGKAINKDSLVFGDKDHPGRIWSIQGSLNDNEAIKTTNLSIYNGRVYQVEVLFKDSSLQNYNVLAGSLREKYGKNKAGMFDAIESKSEFSTTDGNQKIQIILNHDDGFMGEDRLSLRYIYDSLSNQILKEIKDRKVGKVADDL
jgi:hypothetical protein